MGDLSKAIQVYIEYKRLLLKSDLKEKELQDQLNNEFEKNCSGGSFNTAGAETVYKANSAIIKHRQDMVDFQKKLNDAQEIIKAHLKLLKGKRIDYVYETRDRSNDRLTYGFYLNDNGEVSHNHKTKNLC